MKELFCSYQLSKELKQIGFDEPCIARYVEKQFQMNVLGEWYKFNSGEIKGSWISAPLYDQVVRWFREKYSIYMHIQSFAFGWYAKHDNIPAPSTWNIDRRWDGHEYKTYQEALENGILKTIEILKNENNSN